MDGLPKCLVQSTRDGKLAVDQHVLGELRRIDKEVVVVVIAGPYRSGKSYLMNRLAGLKTGFALGSTVQSKTKGIWCWLCPHPKDDSKHLILLDTEGLGDVEKGDDNHDNQILCLAVLLASTFVFNVTAVINNDSIQKLHFVTELAKHIQMRSDQRQPDDSNFDFYFPDFIYVLRDFALELTIDGREVSADEYLEHSLTLRNDRVKEYNKIREAIRKYFKNRKCFTLVSPASGTNIRHLDELADDQLAPEFIQLADEFVKYVLDKSPVKQVKGRNVTGTMLASLLEVYVDQIKNGGMPYIENAVDSMARLQNTEAKEHAVSLYYQSMLEMLHLPVLDENEISNCHNFCLKQSIAAFLKKCIFDENHNCQMEMNKEIMVKRNELISMNAEISQRKCSDTLDELYQTIRNNVRDGSYIKNGGFQEYRNDLRVLKEKFEARLGPLAVKMKYVFLDYMQSLSTQEDIIFQADKKVTDAQAERQKVLDLEMQRAILEREHQMSEQMRRDQERMHKKNLKKMQEFLEEERRANQRYYEDLLNHRLLEHERLLQEGFQEQADVMKSRMKELEAKLESNDNDHHKSSQIFDKILNAFTMGLSLYLRFR